MSILKNHPTCMQRRDKQDRLVTKGFAWDKMNRRVTNIAVE